MDSDGFIRCTYSIIGGSAVSTNFQLAMRDYASIIRKWDYFE